MTTSRLPFNHVNEIFKKIYTNEFWERYQNELIFGIKWTNLEIQYGGPEAIEVLKKTKLGLLVGLDDKETT